MNATGTLQQPGSVAAPFSIEAEKSVLGAVLLDQRHLASVVVDEQLRAEHFYRDGHASVFSAMLALQDAGRQIDHLTVSEQLRARGRLDEIGGPGAVEELAGWVPAAGHARDYARIVRDTAQMRALQRATYEIQSLITERRHAGEALLEDAERIIFALRADASRGRVRMLEDAVTEELDCLQRAPPTSTAYPASRPVCRIWTGCTAGYRLEGCTYSPAARRWARACSHSRSHGTSPPTDSSASCSPASR